MPSGPDEANWRQRAALKCRDELLRRAAREFFPGLSTSEQARQLHRALALYSDTRWRRGDRLCVEAPADAKHKIWWQVLHLRNLVPAEGRLRRILGHSRALELANGIGEHKPRSNEFSALLNFDEG